MFADPVDGKSPIPQLIPGIRQEPNKALEALALAQADLELILFKRMTQTKLGLRL